MELEVTFVGNATTLISAGEITVLTDPNSLHRGQHAAVDHLRGAVSGRAAENPPDPQVH